ncbi:MAG: YqaJ viral recombinase family protein [Hyphomicrobiaceae bacterium]|nr:YqaJ viral recombinase family protein [Hyphomicrobiaceae bacterium]
MIVIDCDQNSPEWFEARRGKVTASRLSDVLAKSAKGYSAGRANYAADLVIERLTGTTIENIITTKPMEWGKENEDNARMQYQFLTGARCERVGLVMHPRITMACASPDRLVDDDGLLEIKCPNTATHIKTLLGGAIDSAYLQQMHWQLACTGRKWVDFVSYDPRLPPEFQLEVRRIPRDPIKLAEIERDVITFLKEVDDTVSELNAKFRPIAA